MKLLAIVITVLGTVSALPGSLPVITAAPELKSISAETSTNHSSGSCTSTDCWASYAECHGTLTFVYLCYTPPPCGTVTSPDPYSCPPLSSSPKASMESTTPSTLTTSTASITRTGAVACTAAATSSS